MAAETTRVKDIPTTATTAAADDYVLLDGATNGTRKGLASNLITPAAAITAADITDLASGRGPLLTGTAPEGATIRIGADVTGDAGSVEAAVIGSALELVAEADGALVATSFIGTWAQPTTPEP